ncbi:MAG: DUF4231 domain-containing protein [Bacteroidetes bacterium]|jgi:hypothetical protein|nr:DUF4231 domain-containing protein [Bacteroidota bacterium]MBT6686722.1 DUF4231 domain-containing protein [Bacteroidota bacterium]MBT7143246.1 DUF4231 domain-containing protein [Bacteroidota bacterium]MBT7492885.1 DUF4231 domain-containing protein [Bacteroidota bacterium]
MEKTEFEEYLKSRYEDQINWYDKKAADNQRIYKQLQWLAIIFSAITPVLVAFDSKPKWLIWITVAISAIVAIATTVIKTFKYQENWINYRTTCETLRKEKHFYTAKINEYDSAEDKEALFVDRVEALISRENTMWLTAQKQTKK